MCSNTKLQSLGDDCWDRICPGFDREQKLACISKHREDICKCCSNSASGDCNILIPGYGMYDACGPVQPNDPYATPREESAREMLRAAEYNPPSGPSPLAVGVFLLIVIVVLFVVWLILPERAREKISIIMASIVSIFTGTP
jgi:hypothetical protein